jgi:hypothetical protein
MIMSTTITQSSIASSYTVTPDPDQPSSAPSTSSAAATGGELPLPLDAPSGGDPTAEVATLLALSFQEDRKHARESSDLEERNRLREGELRVAEMHDKADEIRYEGWARGLTQILSAGCGVTGGVMGLEYPQKADAWVSLFSGGGKGFEATGTILGNCYQADAVDDQANADLLDSQAEASKVAREKFAEEANAARQMFEKVLEFVKEVNEVRSATLQAVASFKA